MIEVTHTSSDDRALKSIQLRLNALDMLYNELLLLGVSLQLLQCRGNTVCRRSWGHALNWPLCCCLLNRSLQKAQCLTPRYCFFGNNAISATMADTYAVYYVSGTVEQIRS